MIGFEFRISTRALEDLVHKAIIEGIPAHAMEVNSFDIQLKVLGSPTVRAEDKCISISLPLGIHFARKAGLFTVQGHGKINVQIESNFDVNASFALSTRSAIATHHWIEKPVIDFGSLDITVEKLVDLILHHYHDMIAYGIDKALKTNFDLRKVVSELVEHVKKEIRNFSFHGLKLFIEPSELLIEPIRNDEGKMVFRGALRADIACAKENPLPANELYLRWVETMLSDTITYVHVDVKEETISDILCEFINTQEYGGEMLVADACTVDFSPEKLNVALKLKSPLQAYVTMTGVPRYNEFESFLYLDKLDVDLKATNLIYRITAPLLNKFLESSFKDRLPVAVDKMVGLQLEDKLPLSMQLNGMHLKADIKKMQVTELLFENGGVKAIVKMDDFLIEGTMD